MTQSQDLANDTIRIALNIAGYNVASMNQFERASAILDMAQELAALTGKRQCDEDSEILESEYTHKEGIWERLAIRSWEQTMKS